MFLTLTITTNAWSAEGDKHTFTNVAFSKLLNNSATISDVTISDPGYPVKTIIVNCRYNKTAGGVTISIKIGGKTFASSKTHNTDNTVDVEFTDEAMQGDIVFSFVNNCGSGTGKGTFYFNSVTLVEAAPAAPCTVTFHTTATTEKEIEEASAGAGVTPPTMEEECGEWEFQGWSESSSNSETSTTPLSLVTLTSGKYYPTKDIDLYPVYTKTTSTGGTAFDKYTQVALGGTITSGKYLISTGSYTMAGNGKNGASFSPGTTEKTAYEYTVTVDGSYFTILGPDGKYVGGNDGTSLAFGTTVANDSYRWKYVNSGIQNKSYTTRHIKAYNTTDFRHYATSNGTLTYLYKRTEKSSGTTYYYSYPQCTTEATYSVTYNGNGNTSGSVPTDATEYAKDAQVTVLGNTGNLAKTGYTFSGWNTKADGTGTPYTAGATFTITENTTLYAKWTAYTINWTINPIAGGSLSATSGNSTTVTPDAAYTYGSPAYTVTSGSATVSKSGNTFTATPSANCTIQINMVEKPKWTVTFNAGEYGTCATTSLKEPTAGAGVKLPDVIANDGYRFLGWATTNNATTANAGVAGEIYKPAIDVTLYAVYIQQFTVQWFANGELLEKVTYDKGAPLLAPTMPVNPCSDEKQHIGWTTQKEYYDPIDAPSPFFEEISGNVTANLKFYAVYATIQSAGLQPQELTETITFNSFTDGTSTRKYDGASSMWLWGKNDGSNIAVYPEIRLYAKHSMTIAPQSGCSISKIVATISENKYVSVFADGGLSGANKSVSELDVTLIPTGGNIVITQSNQSRVVKFVVTFTAAVETPEKRINYTTSCTPPAEYTITWWANGEKYYTQTAVEGTAIDVPTNSPNAATYACDDKVFVGWAESEIDEATDEEPTFITDFDKITENKDFFAVFATEENNDESIFTVGKSGDFKIYAVVDEENKYATAYNNGKLGSTSEENSAVIYTFTHKGENQYTIYNGSKYIAYGTEGTDLKTQSDEYLWKIAPATNGKGSWRITSVSTTSRAIIYNTSHYFKAYATSNITTTGYYDIEIGSAPTTTYSSYVTTCEATTEALSGKFSTGKYEYAEFATGNLQYKPSTDTWRFAKQQYQYVGKDNIYVGKEDYKGWIDLFGWSADDKFGVNSSNDNANYQGEFVDWGKLFPEEGWSTLSKNQWYYLLNQRTNAASLKQIAMVGDTLGIMLFPDEWTLPAGCAPTQQTHHDEEDGEDHSCDFVSYNYTLAHWTELEKAGAIFLPAAGRRTGGWGNETISPHMIGKAELDADRHYKHYADYYAYYWTSTKTDGKVNYLINCTLVDKVKDTYTVHAGHVNWAEEARYGQSVRLAKVTSTLIEIGGGNNSEVIEANAGKTVNVQVNRTFKANDGYYTICLPFDLAAEKIGNVLQISSITENVAEQGMNVVFAPVEILEAGQPYLLLPSKNIENPIFEGVTIVNTTGETTEPVSGAGIKITLTGIINGGGKTDGSTEYYVGDHGYLYNGQTDKLGLRAFFTITDDADQPVKVRARVVVGENTTTGVDNSQLPINNIQKIMENGQLIIIRNGEKFNAQGQKL